jgi:hypothetical protein
MVDLRVRTAEAKAARLKEDLKMEVHKVNK